MASVVKSGYLQKYSKSFLEGGWKNVWVVLHKDSHLLVYKRQGDSSPKAKIVMKEVCKWFAVGQYTDDMSGRPSLPSGARLDCLLAIPQKPSSKAKIHWFVANSEGEFHQWLSAICSTLPPPPQHNSQQAAPPAHSQPITAAPGGPPLSHAPPYNAGHPPSGGASPIGFGSMPMPQGPGGYGPPPGGVPYQQAYPQQPPSYPQQPYAPPQGSYSQQYPTQQYYPSPQGQYGPPPPAAGYGYQQQPMYVQGDQGYAQPAHGAYGAQPNVVYVQQGGHHGGHKKSGGGLGGLGGMMSGNKGKLAAGALGGAALGYGASRLIGGGHGMFGGFGMGPRFGSWSSLSSCGSFGSGCSFGSFD